MEDLRDIVKEINELEKETTETLAERDLELEDDK
jgi:hypothetical protein